MRKSDGQESGTGRTGPVDDGNPPEIAKQFAREGVSDIDFTPPNERWTSYTRLSAQDFALNWVREHYHEPGKNKSGAYLSNLGLLCDFVADMFPR